MDEKTIESRGNSPLLSLVSSFNQTYFPLSANASTASGSNSSHLDPQKLAIALSKAHTIGAGGLFGTSVSSDMKNPDIHTFVLRQGGLTLGTEKHYTNEGFVGELKKAIQEFWVAVLGGSVQNAAVVAQEIVNFEIRLARIKEPA